MKNIFKIFRNYFEFIIFLILKNFMRLFSFNFASNFGGVLVSLFGRYTKYKKIIKSNIEVLNLSNEASSNLVKDNLKETGKVFFELIFNFR